eukprot:362940-Chlamydomonas_euryale.AAC.5
MGSTGSCAGTTRHVRCPRRATCACAPRPLCAAPWPRTWRRRRVAGLSLAAAPDDSTPLWAGGRTEIPTTVTRRQWSGAVAPARRVVG